MGTSLQIGKSKKEGDYWLRMFLTQVVVKQCLISTLVPSIPARLFRAPEHECTHPRRRARASPAQGAQAKGWACELAGWMNERTSERSVSRGTGMEGNLGPLR